LYPLYVGVKFGFHLLREQHTGVSRQVAGEIVWLERVEVTQNELCTLYISYCVIKVMWSS